MDTLFFFLSKILWMLLSPDAALVIMAVLLLICILKRYYQAAKILAGALCLILMAVSVLPMGDWLFFPLENRFPVRPVLPPHVDGIIMLGGAEKIDVSYTRQTIELNQFSERYFEFLRLIRLYPGAKKVYTGGNGDMANQQYKGSEVAKKLFEEQGIDTSSLIFESDSRNTYENAIYTKKMIGPAPDEVWVLITSAAHMPRSFGIFEKAGWNVIPYPVDHYTSAGPFFRLDWDLSGNLRLLNAALKEWTGLAVYYLTGKTSRLFPGP